MTMVERLGRWKDEGVITPSQFERLGAIVRKDRFSVALELNALLYLGVLSIAAGLLWTVRTHFIALGDTAIVAALTVIVALCFGYCFARALSPGEVESPTVIFDYGHLDAWCSPSSWHALETGSLARRFVGRLYPAVAIVLRRLSIDNRFVLSLALSALGAWFGSS
jgi:hypothetical protein